MVYEGMVTEEANGRGEVGGRGREEEGERVLSSKRIGVCVGRVRDGRGGGEGRGSKGVWMAATGQRGWGEVSQHRCSLSTGL